MSILPLAAWPAATKVAREAVVGSAQVGKSFLNLVANWTDSKPNSAELPAAQVTGPEPDSLDERSASFSQRFANWLRQQPWFQASSGDSTPLSVELSLDRLDRPHATLAGQPSTELDQALQSDPSWLHEFRDIALDRIEQSSSVDLHSAPPSLTIEQRSATIEDKVDHRWN